MKSTMETLIEPRREFLSPKISCEGYKMSQRQTDALFNLDIFYLGGVFFKLDGAPSKIQV